MGLFPEHTNGSYSSAFYEGVDFVELDIQYTKDGIPVTSHDPTILWTTDILDHLDKFGDRMVNISFPEPYNYEYINDFVIHDFTLAELKTLRKR